MKWSPGHSLLAQEHGQSCLVKSHLTQLVGSEDVVLTVSSNLVGSPSVFSDGTADIGPHRSGVDQKKPSLQRAFFCMSAFSRSLFESVRGTQRVQSSKLPGNFCSLESWHCRPYLAFTAVCLLPPHSSSLSGMRTQGLAAPEKQAQQMDTN